MQVLWTEAEASYAGEFVRFPAVRSFPKPAQPAGIPILLGIHDQSFAMKQVPQYGDGWCPGGMTPEQAEQRLPDIRRAWLRSLGRMLRILLLLLSPCTLPDSETYMPLHRYSSIYASGISTMTSTLTLILTAILLSGCQTAPLFTPMPVHTVSIKEARGRATGETVRVAGTVTVQSGAFASSRSSGFAIQDDTAGIYVLDTQHVFQLGDTVHVTGTRDVEFHQLHIRLEAVKKLDGSGTVTPRPVKTGDVGEDDEGALIQVQGRITRVEDDKPYGYKVFIDDGSGAYQIFIDASTELIKHTAVWQTGDTVRVIGFAGQFDKTYEIMPRVVSDMKKQ